ncbi:MAG: restriction endonuclease subunit S [Alphaproteobacteria bacterium]
MKAAWEFKALEDMASFSNGLWTGKKSPLVTAKVIRNTNFRPNGALSLEDVAEIKVEAKQLEKRQLRFGDIVLEKSGGGPKQAVGRVIRFEIEDEGYSFSNFTSAIRVVRTDRLDYRYLHHVLNWWYASGVTEKIQSNSTGIRNLDLKAYKALPIPLPPLDEQKRIVTILDESFEALDRARVNAEANFADAADIYSSALNSLFTSTAIKPVRSLDSLIEIGHGFAFDGGDFEVSSDVSKPIVLTPGNYSESGELVFTAKNTKRLMVKPPAQYILARGDLTVVMTDLSSKMKILGKPAFVRRDDLLHNQRIGRVIPKDASVNLSYIYHFLNSNVARSHIISTATGTMVRHTAPKRILALKIPYSEDGAQLERAVDRLDEIHEESVNLSECYSRKISEISALRQSLLQKAFAGELT